MTDTVFEGCAWCHKGDALKEGGEPSLKTGVQEGVAERNRVPPAPGSEKAMAPHSSTLAWKIPWMEEPGGLQSMGSLRVGHD